MEAKELLETRKDQWKRDPAPQQQPEQGTSPAVKDIGLQIASFALRAALRRSLQSWVGFKESVEIDQLSIAFYLFSPCFAQQPGSE